MSDANNATLHQIIERSLRAAVAEHYAVELAEVIAEKPPKPELGDIAFPVAFELARVAKTAPRKIAETLRPAISQVDGVVRVEVAGAGYLNVFLNRGEYLHAFLAAPDPPAKLDGDKFIVEHTAINPNKAAHIGHLRNAALGDTLVRVLRYSGERVEVQNYIDDTGVQVADVVVGFIHMKSMSLDDVRAVAESERFDYYCWELYASISDFYAEDADRLKLREEMLHAIERGLDPGASMADFIARRISKCHLKTMERIDVQYDLLAWEGDIIRLRFWERAFELMKQTKAIRLAEQGKHQGCWVMELDNLQEDGSIEPVSGNDAQDESNEKVIVRSNGVVTYVGKDIAYQMWKLGLLDRDFGYERFYRYDRDDTTVWSTSSNEGERPDEDFGHGDWVYNVIDVRQSYPQRVVQQGVGLIGSAEARERSRHFAYEMVALTPATCRELGFPVSKEDESKPYLEVSGRKGLGVKADDLLTTLAEKALPEVVERNPELSREQTDAIVQAIAVGALRYFMLKTTKNRVIAFDLSEALSFEGDSGPYLQYSVVRASKILDKIGVSRDTELIYSDELAKWNELDDEESDDVWMLIRTTSELVSVCELVRRTEEPAHLSRYALQQAQRFNGFYHRYRIAGEQDPTRRAIRLFAVQLFRRQQIKTLSLMGIPVPEKM